MINAQTGNQEDLEDRYRSLSDDGLMQLSIDGGLRAQAAIALRIEMERRSLGRKDVKALADWEEQQKPPPPPPQHVFLGYGVRFVGKKFLSQEDKRQGVFVSTKFVVLKYASIFPISSYRVTQRDGEFPQIENRVSLQWDQVWSAVRPALLAALIGFVLAAAVIYFTERK